MTIVIRNGKIRFSDYDTTACSDNVNHEPFSKLYKEATK